MLASVVPVTVGCRIRSSHPYWIENHGHGEITRLAAWPTGALAIGTDKHLWGYPGPWGASWYPNGDPQDLRAITASKVAAYGIFNDGQVARFTSDKHWTALPGSAEWGATELGATQDDRLFVVVGGKVQILDGGALRATPPCPATGSAVAVAGTLGEEGFVIDQEGGLHRLAGGVCTPLTAPRPLQRIAAFGSERLLAVATDGTVWRFRNAAWTALPPPFKYRPGQRAAVGHARDISVSAYSTWLLDDRGNVFLLSDES